MPERRSLAPYLAVGVGGIAGLVAGLLILDQCRPTPVIDDVEVIPDLGENADDEEITTRLLRGKVLLEPAEPGQTMAPPAPGSCTASAYHAGHRLAGPVACDEQGNYELTLDTLEVAKVGVEVVVPGRLRGFIDHAGEGPVPTMALGFASSVRGEVVDTRGRPLAGAVLEAMPTPNLGESEPWRIWTEEDGSFVLDTVPPGHLNLRARHPGYAPTAAEVFAPESGVLLVLDGLLDLRGQLVGPPKLVSRAKVRIEGSAVWPPIEANVGSDGSFTFEGILDGIYALDAVVEAQTPGDVEYATVPLENVPPDMFVSLALVEAARVPVAVVNAEGESVANARIVMRYGALGMLPRMATTDAQGRALPGPVVPGPYLIAVDADGYLPAEPVAVDVRTDAELPLQTITLMRPATLSGTVVDGRGLGVEGAEVLVESEALYTPGLSAVRASAFSALVAGGSLGVTRGTVPAIPLTDTTSLDALGLPGSVSDQMVYTNDQGQFRLSNVPPGAYRLHARHRDFAASDSRLVELGSGERRGGVVLRLLDGTHLDGRVLNTNLQPIVGARVEFADGTSVLTDSRGMFDGGQRRGRQRIVIRADGMVPREVVVVLGSRPKSIDTQLEVADSWLHGRVVDGNLRPIAGVRVRLDPVDGLSPTEVRWTDERGVFEFDELAKGRLDLALHHPDYAPTTQRAAAPDDIEVKLYPGWGAEIVVRTPIRGEPIADAVVKVGTREYAVDDDGYLKLAHLTGDSIKVVVRAPGRVRAFTEISRGETEEVTIELEEASGMQGVITDERGEPVAGATVIVRDLDGVEVARTTSRAGGVWQAMGLAEGDYEVEAIPPPTLRALLAPVAQESDVLRGHVTREVDLRFDRL